MLESTMIRQTFEQRNGNEEVIIRNTCLCHSVLTLALFRSNCSTNILSRRQIFAQASGSISSSRLSIFTSGR